LDKLPRLTGKELAKIIEKFGLHPYNRKSYGI